MILRFTLLLFFAAASVQLTAQTKSLKRGLAYGHHTARDLQAIAPGISWWYNWHHQPEDPVAEVYSNYDVDYVPMAWNGSFDKEKLRTYLQSHPNVKYLLGWNEPNFVSQANMTPSQAAEKWKDLEEIADEFYLQLVSPAVNYCDVCVSENGVTYTDPIKYLDDFFAACVDCRIDHIAIHSYMGNVSALQWFVSLFKKYGKPIWLTEFANWENNPTPQQQIGFMIGAVDYLENDPDVFRYAWFTGRHTGPPYIGVFEAQSGVLSDLGKVYVAMPLHNEEHYTTLPARIEAEAYNTMYGVLLEATSDVDGLANVGYIDPNDWLIYGVNAPDTDEYNLKIRIASTAVSSLEFQVDDQPVVTLPIPNTAGWQNWTTIESSLPLSAGQHKIKLKANAGGFNINWLQLSNGIVLSGETEKSIRINLFPNPAKNLLHIQTDAVLTSITIFDTIGRRIVNQKFDHEIDLASIPAGTYIIAFETINGTTVYQRFTMVN